MVALAVVGPGQHVDTVWLRVACERACFAGWVTPDYRVNPSQTALTRARPSHGGLSGFLDGPERQKHTPGHPRSPTTHFNMASGREPRFIVRQIFISTATKPAPRRLFQILYTVENRSVTVLAVIEPFPTHFQSAEA